MGRLIYSFLCSSLLACGVAHGQAPEKYFGFGLDSFYQADYEGVIAHMDRAESLGLRDSRLYLYRGIAKVRAGQDESGKSDLQSAADREAKFGTRYVGRLSERLSGTEHSTLSEYRGKARRKLIAEKEAQESDIEELIAPARSSVVEATSAIQLTDDATDPFQDDSLGRGELVAASTENQNDAFADGGLDTGVDAFSDTPGGFDDSFTDASGDAEISGFEAGDFGGGDAQPAPKKKKGIFGSIFSAIGKSAVPTKAIENVAKQIPGLPGGPGPGMPPGEGPPPGFGDDGGGFGDDEFDDADFGGDASDEDFGDFDDEFGDDMSDDGGSPFVDDEF